MAIDPRTGQTIIDPLARRFLASAFQQQAPNTQGGFLAPIAETAAGLFRERKAIERQDAQAAEFSKALGAIDTSDPAKLESQALRMMLSGDPRQAEIGQMLMGRVDKGVNRGFREREVSAREAGVLTFDQRRQLARAGGTRVNVSTGGGANVMSSEQIASRNPQNEAAQNLARQFPGQLWGMGKDGQIKAIKGDDVSGDDRRVVTATGNLKLADEELNAVEEFAPEALRPGIVETGISAFSETGANLTRSTERQAAEGASDAWAGAMGTILSGAAVTPLETARLKKSYLPSPGDTDRTISNKTRLRRRITQMQSENQPVAVIRKQIAKDRRELRRIEAQEKGGAPRAVRDPMTLLPPGSRPAQ